MKTIDFLMSVWSQQCEPGEFVCVASKGTDWHDHSMPFNDELPEKLKVWLDRHEGEDLYFCPLPFSKPKRRKEFVTRSNFAWSDIDDGDPHKVEPTILWESSPGRYAGLWRLRKSADPDVAAEYSRRIAYYIGADRGGWDLTQVLRIPGTVNNKYPERPTVKLIRDDGPVLNKVPQTPLDRWRASIPRALMRTIEGPATVGKRSEMLWKLENQLAEIGIPTKDIVAILKDSEWNKFRGRADEDERFAAEMGKIVEEKPETRTESVELIVTSYSDLLGSQATFPGWMVRDYWQRGSHGIIAGEPKSFKSTLAMDMLFSVAADKPFLGQYKVEYGGPVIIVQNENADHIMKDRTEKLMFSRGEIGNVKARNGRLLITWPRQLPMFFINQQGFTLDDAANKEALEDLIRLVKPAAIKLDPLYLMFSGDVNSAKELYPVLQWCLYIKQTYNCAVILVHHYNKGGEGKRGGQRMLGSTTLHGWIESAWYIQVQDDGVVELEREFRGAGLYPRRGIRLEMGDFGDPHYATTEFDPETAQGERSDLSQLLDILGQSADAMNKTAIAKRLGISRRQADKLVDTAVKEGAIVRVGERYKLGVDE